MSEFLTGTKSASGLLAKHYLHADSKGVICNFSGDFVPGLDGNPVMLDDFSGIVDTPKGRRLARKLAPL